MALIPSPKDGDWTSLRMAIRKLSSLKLGSGSTPTFAGLTLTEAFSLSYLTEKSILFAGPSGLISQDNTNLSWDDATNVLTVANIIDSGLTASKGVYTDADKKLTSTAPASGAVGYWSRTGTVLSTATANDDVSLGNDLLFPNADSVINFGSGDITVTYTENTLTVAGMTALALGASNLGCGDVTITGTLGAGATTLTGLTITNDADIGKTCFMKRLLAGGVT